MFDVLQEYKKWWASERLKNGTKWNGKDNRLFIQANGSAINPDTINFWLNQFTEKNSLPHTNPHALRHTFATLQIANGVDVRTLQALTGHAQASTLLNTYSHALQSAEESATKALGNTLIPNDWKQKAQA